MSIKALCHRFIEHRLLVTVLQCQSFTDHVSYYMSAHGIVLTVRCKMMLPLPKAPLQPLA